MKCVILICLLSLSVCFSASVPSEVPAQAAPGTSPGEPQKHEADPKAKTPEKAEPTLTPAADVKKENHTEPVAPPTIAANTTTSPSTDKNDTKPTEKDNKTDTKPTKDVPKPEEKTTEAPKTTNATTTVAPQPTTKNGTTPDHGNKTDGTTKKDEVVVTTETPKVQSSRAFDGPSFIGGIILTLGLLAIGFMGFKYYKNQTERNYHTL